MYSGEKTFFSRWGRENWTATCERMMLEHSLTSHTKISSKFIKDLIVGLSTIKFLEGSTGRTFIFLDINRNNYFFGFVSQSNGNKDKSKQMGPKLKSFFTAKETINKMKRQTLQTERTYLET